MKMKSASLIVMIFMVCAGMLAGAIEQEVELPLGTQVETPAAGQLILVLPSGQRLELEGVTSIQAEFSRCILRGPGGGILMHGIRAKFLQPATEKLVVLPAEIRLVALGDDVMWVRQSAPVPPGSYIRINEEVVWLPAKIHFLKAGAQAIPVPNPKKPGVVPR